MRYVLAALSLTLLGACDPAPPLESTGGVGFGNYVEYQKEREAALTQNRSTPVPIGAPGTIAPGASGAPLSAVNPPPMGAAPAASGPITSSPITSGPIMSAPVASGPIGGQTADISDEQDFDAVAARETIESDKARIEQNRQQYQQVQPGALPERSGEAGPNIVDYALSAPNRLGESVYNRSSLAGIRSHERACGRFTSQDLAQTEFLRRGGPNRDPGNLDPDGDGYACRWDPTPFQNVRN